LTIGDVRSQKGRRQRRKARRKEGSREKNGEELRQCGDERGGVELEKG
jgi:hypothetical protein